MRMRGLAVQMQELSLSIGNTRHQVVMYMMYNVLCIIMHTMMTIVIV